LYVCQNYQSMIKILIADDHPIVRKGMINIISDEQDMKVVCEASNGSQVMDLIKTNDVDLVILDISMPGKSGLEVLDMLKNVLPELPVLILSALSEEIYASKSLKAGASGFINKETAPEELITAIRKILAGGHYISSALAERVALDFKGDLSKAPHARLSSREFQILCLIGAGRSVTEIGKDLFLNVKTISTYRSRILQKMNMQNNAELIRYCINEGIVR
jgi:two-component system, NarL family, invasion response regulator UvrY